MFIIEDPYSFWFSALEGTMASSKLPEEIMLNILVRLPVKSLVRFKCVHKSWRTLITSPDFIAKHWRQAVSRSENSCLLVKYLQQETRMNVVTLLYPIPRGGTPDRFANLDLPLFNENETHLEVLPVCANGIVCLYDHGERIVLWNPALKESKVIPVHPVSVPSHLDATTKGVGFGYDAQTDDYKVVRITEFWNDEGEPPPSLVEVYSLKTASWRKVETDMNDYIRYGKCTEMFLNETYHWWALDSDYDEEEEREVILGFDISKEVFRKIQLPMALRNTDWTKWKCFAVLNNCIALILYPLNSSMRCFDIWVMKEYGVEESWTKELSIGPLGGIDRPLGFWNNDKLLLATPNGEIIICDLETQEQKTLDIYGLPDSLRVLNYTESLVSIQRGD